MNEKKSFLHKNKGVTLIELIAVVAIILILASIVTPMVFGHMDDAKKVKTDGDFNLVYSWVKTGYQDWKMKDGNELVANSVYNISNPSVSANSSDAQAIRKNVDFYVSNGYALGTDSDDFQAVITSDANANLKNITITHMGETRTFEH
ncbi:MAG: type II secretion system protein [Lachnospirales bacterium]